MLQAAISELGVCIAPRPFVADDISTGRLLAPHGFIENGQDYVALRRVRRHRKSSLFCAWLQQEAQDLVGASGPYVPCNTSSPPV